VDAAFLRESRFCGLPVVPFDEVGRQRESATHDMFVALSYSMLNQVRRETYLAATD
jgi:hypothetical protein